MPPREQPDSQPTGALRRILRNSSWLVGAQGVSALLSLAQGLLIARALGAGGFGKFVLVTTLVTTITQLCDSRIWETIINFVPRYREAGQPVRAAAVVQLCVLLEVAAGIVALAIMVAIAPYAAATWIKDPAVAGIIAWYALAALLEIPQEPANGLLRVADRFDWISYHKVAVSAVKATGVTLAFFLQPTLSAMLAAQLIGTAVGGLLFMAMVYRASRALELPLLRLAALRQLRGQFGELLRFVAYTNLNSTGKIVTSKADILLLGWLGSPAAVGAYELAKRLVGQFNVVGDALYAAVYPELSRQVAAGQFDRVRRLQRQLIRSILAATIPVCLAATFAAPWVIPLVLGLDFTPSVLLFQILVWQLLWLPLVWARGFLLATGHVAQATALTWADSLIYLTLLATLTPWLDAPGAALATTLRFLIWIGLATMLIRRVRSSWGEQSLRETQPSQARAA